MSDYKQVDLFLERYRRLEAAASNILPRDSKGGVIARLLRMPKFARYREELDCCREVRNLLTHEVRVDGDPAIVPSEGMVRFLDKIIDLINNPLRVRDRMTPLAMILSADYDSPVIAIMEKMKKKDLSRVPVLNENIVKGMFSIETVFRSTLEGLTLTETTTIGDLQPYLALDAAPITTYRFVPPHLALEAAEDMFYHAYGRKSKIRALLVTANGSSSEPLMGIISPYDVLGN